MSGGGEIFIKNQESCAFATYSKKTPIYKAFFLSFFLGGCRIKQYTYNLNDRNLSGNMHT